MAPTLKLGYGGWEGIWPHVVVRSLTLTNGNATDGAGGGVDCGGFATMELTDVAIKHVDVQPLLRGPVFEPLLREDFFAQVSLDPTCGTVVWPNGADFAPEALYELPDVA